MNDNDKPLELRHCSCEGGEVRCPNDLHGMPDTWLTSKESGR